MLEGIKEMSENEMIKQSDIAEKAFLSVIFKRFMRFPKEGLKEEIVNSIDLILKYDTVLKRIKNERNNATNTEFKYWR
jgi:hypothetical protein